MSKTHTTFYKNTAWQYGLQIVKYIFPLLTMPYLTRVLEPEGYAVYAYVVSFMGFAQTFVDFGFNLSGTKRIASAKNVEEENRAVGAITQARLLLCAIGAIAVLLIASAISITRDNLFYTMLAYCAVCGKALAPDFVFQGHEDMEPLTTRYLISKGASTALTFVCVRSLADLLWVPVLDIISSLLALVWSFSVARKKFGIAVVVVPMKSAFRELKISGLYCISNMSSSVFSGFTTLLIGVVVEDAAQISYWSLAMSAVSAVQSLYTPIANSMYPHMVKLGDFGFVKKIALIALPAVLLGTLAFILLRDTIILVLGGSEYLAGSWILAAISPVLPLSFFAILFGWPVLGAAGKVREIATSTVMSALFCIIALVGCAALGRATMPVICGIRCVTEAVLCFQRLWYCRDILVSGQAAD